MGALNKLEEVPELLEKFFEGAPEIGIRFDDMGKYAMVETFNEKFHVLDPGRYIGRAREGALIPYPFDKADDAENRRQLSLYLEGLKRLRPKKPEPRSGGSTLEPFLESDEVKVAADELETEKA